MASYFYLREWSFLNNRGGGGFGGGTKRIWTAQGGPKKCHPVLGKKPASLLNRGRLEKNFFNPAAHGGDRTNLDPSRAGGGTGSFLACSRRNSPNPPCC